MSEETVLGIDIGTASTKGVLARLDGTIVALAQREHTLSLPRPGWAEHDAEAVWWNDVRSIVAELLSSAGHLRAVCVSGIGPCLLPCDDRLQPLRPAILYGIDTRAGDEITELEEWYGPDEILARSGSALSSQALGPKLLWLRRHEADIWARCAAWHMASSFIVARLTGEYVLDHHSASQCAPLYDLAASTWAEDVASEIAPGVPLPRLAWPAEVVGTVTRAGAQASGLPEGVAVVAGTIDAWAEAFSVGVRRPGDLMLMYGSSMFFVQVVEAAERHPLLWTTEGIEAGTRTLAAGMSTAGSITTWVRNLSGNPTWEDLLSEAAAVPPGADGLLLLPYFAGERTPIYDPHARGVAAGLTLTHGRGALLRAAYEGTGFGASQILALLANAGGAPSRIVAAGGGTRSQLWLQIVSDIAGVAQLIPEQTVGASYGGALLAAIGAGLVPKETDWALIAKTVEPSEGNATAYGPLSELYERLYRETSDIVHRLGQPMSSP